MQSMRSRTEVMLGKNVVDHPFPKGTGFWMTLKGLEHRVDMSGRVNVRAVAFAVPGPVGIVNLQVALLGRWGDCW